MKKTLFTVLMLGSAFFGLSFDVQNVNAAEESRIVYKAYHMDANEVAVESDYYVVLKLDGRATHGFLFYFATSQELFMEGYKPTSLEIQSVEYFNPRRQTVSLENIKSVRLEGDPLGVTPGAVANFAGTLNRSPTYYHYSVYGTDTFTLERVQE